MKPIDIKGTPYVTVATRVKEFRENFKGWRIITTIKKMSDGVCVFQAEIRNENDSVVATGHALEKENSTFINKTSFLENCETSAVGRALAMLGIGVENSIGSAEEVANAIQNQKKGEQ